MRTSYPTARKKIAREDVVIVELNNQDIDEIIELEKLAFPAELQANRDTYLARFKLGHIVLGYRQGHLLGIISFSYGSFYPHDLSTIPDNFYDWSTQKVSDNWNTVFIYNLGLLPDTRGSGATRALITRALERAVYDGCTQALGEGPIPSYAGNSSVKSNPNIKKNLDNYAAGGPMPSQELLFKDPHLALYRRVCPCSVIQLMPEFLPSDHASGGFRAMLFRCLSDFEVKFT